MFMFTLNGVDITNEEEYKKIQALFQFSNDLINHDARLRKASEKSRDLRNNQKLIDSMMRTAPNRGLMPHCEIAASYAGGTEGVPIGLNNIQVLWHVEDVPVAVGWSANFVTRTFHALSVPRTEVKEVSRKAYSFKSNR